MARMLDLGGSERQMIEIAKALDRSKFDPQVGCFRPEGLRGNDLAAVGVPIVQFPVYSFASTRTVTEAWRLGRYIRRNGIRLVHTFDYPLTVFAVPAARFLSSAVVLSSQRAHRELIPRGYRSLVRITDHFADAVVVNCEFIRKHLEHDEHVPGRRIQLCYNGIDLEAFRPAAGPRPAALPPDAVVIGVICALRPEKNLTTLLDAFARARPACSGIKLAIVGSGPMLAPLQSEARALGILSDCIFEPATAEVARWLSAMDIFVLPSRTEALSNSLMEAMACGCCVVASNVGGNPELVRHQETGFLFEAGDAAALAAMLQSLIKNESLRKQTGAAAAEWIQRFSIRASAERMGEIYTELIERSDG